MELDKQDLKILQLLQTNLKVSIEIIAENVGLSLASINRRIKRLRENKIITSEVAVVSPKAVGQHMTFLVSVELERENIEKLVAFKHKIKQEPRIQQCYYVTGEADFILVVLAKNMEDFDQFTQQIFFNDSNVRRYNTSVVMDRTKVSLEVPLS